MINWVVDTFRQGIQFVRRHSQVQLALVLIIIVPVVFLYSGSLFLTAGHSNQDKLQRDRIEILHQSLAAMTKATQLDIKILQSEIETMAESAEGVTKLRIVLKINNELVPIAALDTAIVGIPQKNPELYQNAAVRNKTSVIFPFRVDGERIWQAVYVDTLKNGQYFYILSENSFAEVDAYMAASAERAYAGLFILYLVLLFIAYWHARMVNYRVLYLETKHALEQQHLFTNMVAHELRAPLTAIRGYTSLIQERQELSGETAVHLKRVRSSTERLLAVVNDLLDVARIQSGKLEVRPESVDIVTVVEAVLAELHISAQEKSITLSHTGQLKDAQVKADPKRLHQALVNLVSNAIKYTEQGSIEIDIRPKRQAYEIRVKDTGMGMTATDQKKLFSPFFRIQNQKTQMQGGTGLGMWITRQFVELMHGTIDVESIKEVGTHIVITIPIKAE